MMRVALDTNILAYAEGVGDASRCARAIKLIEELPAELVLLPAQTLGELFRVLTGKAKREAGLTRVAIMTWADSFEVADSSWSAFQAAMDLAIDHGLQIRDALIMAVAAENRCRLLLTEDLQSGFIWRGVTVVNPFAASSSPLLDTILQTR
ncbi:MAG: PIN domain-containing protein [Desulfosalsimonadaceae bacterium]